MSDLDKEELEYRMHELRLYAENTGDLYPEVRKAVGELARCNPRNHYGVLIGKRRIPCMECLAPWSEIVRIAGRRYQKEIQPMHFSASVIHAVALEWATDYLQRLSSGEQGLHD